MLFHFDCSAFWLARSQRIQNFAVLRVVLANDLFIQRQVPHSCPFVQRSNRVDLTYQPDKQIVSRR